jgi:hypothetical protein
LLLCNLMVTTATLAAHIPTITNGSLQAPQPPIDSWTASAQAINGVGLALIVNNNFASPGYVTAPQLGALVGAHVYVRFWQWRRPMVTVSGNGNLDGEATPMQDMSPLASELEPPTSNQYAHLSLLPVDSNDSEDLSEDPTSCWQTNDTHSRRYSSGHARFSTLMIAWFICLPTIWIAVFIINSRLFGGDLRQRPPPSLDHDYRPSHDVEIVVSMYREDPDMVATMIDSLQILLNRKGRSVSTTIYVKDSHVDPAKLTERLGATRVYKRSNVGREGETYLHHIISQWDNLAKHTLFIQAHVHNIWEVQRRIETYFKHETGALMLGFSGHTCKCADCSDRWGWSDARAVDFIYGKVHKENCSEVLLSYKGQFIASAERLRGLNRTKYEDLHRVLIDQHAWTHTEPYLRGRPDSLNAPYFGFTLERMWSVLLQCSEVDIALKCPTLLAGSRRGGNFKDCQCIDARR